MLSLARRENETLHFHTSDGLIAVTIRVIKGNQVKLAIDAPENVNIVRSEIDDQINGASFILLASAKLVDMLALLGKT